MINYKYLFLITILMESKANLKLGLVRHTGNLTSSTSTMLSDRIQQINRPKPVSSKHRYESKDSYNQ